MGFKYNYKNWMHSFEVSLGYESVDRTTFSTWNAYDETSKECIQFLNKESAVQ